MKIIEFQIENFRSINDSGPIRVEQRTALVGRNESGKSNLLLALASLKPPGKLKSLSEIKDFPRDRSRSDFSEDLTVVATFWELSPDETAELASIFPRARDVNHVRVYRRYKAARLVGFEGLSDLEVSHELVQDCLTKIGRSVNGALRVADNATASAVKFALTQLAGELDSSDVDPEEWAESTPEAIDRFRNALLEVSFGVAPVAENNLRTIRQHAADLQNDRELHQRAIRWVIEQLPVFLYLSDYPELNGHQNIAEYLKRKEEGELTEADINFEKLVKVAELDPEELDALLDKNHEERQLHTNRAGALVTEAIRKLWTDRELTFRFNLDAQHFDTLVSDPNGFYAVDVNLDERSRGFKWFFSFYITFTADTKGGPAENAILLLDEPGLYLHATAQRNLLEHFATNFQNQIIYTTHSPFMIPTGDLSSIRTVNIAQDSGTTVTNDPTGDHRTLFPLQAALGYDLTQTMFIGQHNLVVEGVTDYWYLSAISDQLEHDGGKSLPRDLVITPAGGAQKVSYMATLLAAQQLSVLVMLDDERDAKETANELIRSKLIRSENVISIREAFGTPPSEADIEDLIDPRTFAALVNEVYAKELAATTITLNPAIPRIVKRYEAAFTAAGMQFHKTRPAKLFLRGIATDPALITPLTKLQFESLFEAISNGYQRLVANPKPPFER
jgi:predicted ATP-dependent endonuclease of OLD family